MHKKGHLVHCNLLSVLIITDGVIISDSPFLNFAPKECRKIREKFFQNSCGMKNFN